MEFFAFFYDLIVNPYDIFPRLNAADINIPQWKFSKMIHNARIKFTDHSILRIVQILGTLGNWRRVLQVVEWFQSRERFKSLKSRSIYELFLKKFKILNYYCILQATFLT